MDQRIPLIEANITNFSIDKIYSILWYTISTTQDYQHTFNIFICPHTVIIESLQNQDHRIHYQPQGCNNCPQTEYRRIQNSLKYKYMICGILYFLLEGNNNLQQYYTSQNFFFLKNIYGYYNENQYYLRSICQILRKQDFEQKQIIVNVMPEANRPSTLANFQLNQYCVLIISPCLGTPQHRQIEDNNAFYLRSFQNFLQDLRQISLQIGIGNVPPPCLHNIFISGGNHRYCKFRINIYQTDPICRCQNNQMGTILYSLLTGEEYVDRNRRDGDLFMDDELIQFSIFLISKYRFNSAEQQFNQYEGIITRITQFSTNSIILQNNINASFYAYHIHRNLRHIQQIHLWEYYKILFLQEMIELLENKILNQLQVSVLQSEQLSQLKENQRIGEYLQNSENQLLLEIQQNYIEQQNPLTQIVQQHQIQENIHEFPHLFVVRWHLFQQFSGLISFDDPQNQFFRNQFGADFNFRTIIEFEEQLRR